MSLVVPPDSSARLVTQNLLISAAAATEPNRFVTDENVEDLATVISLSCIYDRLVLVGPQHLLDFANPLVSFLRETVVETQDVADSDWKRAVESAERYAGAFFGVGRLQYADDIFNEIHRMSRRYGIDTELVEDGPSDIQIGRNLLEGVRSADELRERIVDPSSRIIIAYVLRTFLYIGFSDRLGMPLAVDAARQPLITQVAEDSQRRIREAVMQTIAEGLRTDTSLRRPLRRIASPFAAIIFNESKNRSAMVARLKTLRDEQLEFRLKLRPLELTLETATGGERDQAEARIAAALERLAKAYSVKTSQDLTIRRIVAFAKPAADLISLNPADALDAAAVRLLNKDAEKTLAELHELKRRMPSSADQDADIRRLFDV